MTHHRYRVLLLVLCCPLLWSAKAGAVTPAALKTSTPLTQAGIQQVNSSVAADVAKMTAPGTLAQGRKGLIDEADTATGGATAAYQKAYGASVIAAMTPLLTNPEMTQVQRLNAAIVLGQVAARVARTNSADQFEPIARTMMKDKSWQVALWGVKVARYALANALLNKNKTALPADIEAAAKANEKQGEIIEEAYLALVLDGIRADPAYGDCLKQTLTVMLDLIKWRTTLYANGDTPAAPAAESGPANTLPIDGFAMLSAKGNSQLMKETLKTLGDLVSAQLTTIAAANGSADPALVDATERLGTALTGFGLKLGNASLQTAGSDINKMGANPQPATITKCQTQLTTALADAMSSLALASN